MGNQERLKSLLLEAVRIHYEIANETMQRLDRIETAINALSAKGTVQQTPYRSRSTMDIDPVEQDIDPLIIDAMDIFVREQHASTSLLQRRLRVGYSRASRIVDQLEQQNLIGPFAGSRTREVLLTEEEWRMVRREFVSSTFAKETAT